MCSTPEPIARAVCYITKTIRFGNREFLPSRNCRSKHQDVGVSTLGAKVGAVIPEVLVVPGTRLVPVDDLAVVVLGCHLLEQGVVDVLEGKRHSCRHKVDALARVDSLDEGPDLVLGGHAVVAQ